VEFGADRVTLKRTSLELPDKGAVVPAWSGAALAIGEVRLGDAARRTGVTQNASDHQVATYALGAGESATVVLSRLTPAVLVDSGGASFAFQGGGGGLDKLIARPAHAARAAGAAPHVAALEKHVAEMIDAGHLAPLFYVYGGIGGAGPAYFYWANPAELAVAAAEAYPWLSSGLQRRLKEYLRAEWEANPPFVVSDAAYRRGANRAPYNVPWQDIGRSLAATMFRERARRGWRQFADLYGVAAYYELTGDREPPGLRKRCGKMMRDVLAGQDWALMSPIHRKRRVGFFRGVNYFDRNGQATCSGLVAGAIGLVRLGKRFRWRDEREIGMYLLARFAVARVGQARYTAELRRRGLVNGEAAADWRTLVHIDRRCALTFRGHLAAVVREDQEAPPFIGLVPEVGRLLGRHARGECGIYLDHLDRSMPLWYVSEAPKQSASEQRLCPLQHKSGNVLAQYWVLGKRGEEFRRYVDVTRFRGDLYYIRNLAALIDSYGRGGRLRSPEGAEGNSRGRKPPVNATHSEEPRRGDSERQGAKAPALEHRTHALRNSLTGAPRLAPDTMLPPPP
jgi:hypothetical protein